MPGIHEDGSFLDSGHHGLDLGSYDISGKQARGQPVSVALAGRISSVIYDRPPYGNMIMVETPFESIPPALVTSQSIPKGDSVYTLYAHLQNPQFFQLEQKVECGQHLAETGMTGATGGPHLHFETRWGPPNTEFPVMASYGTDIKDEEKKYYYLWRNSGVYHVFDPMELLSPLDFIAH